MSTIEAVPDFQTLMRPLLALVEDGEPHAIADLRGSLAEQFDLSEEDLADRIPSGRVTTLQNRVGWAAAYLYRCGLLERPERAHYRITERGRDVLSSNHERIDLNVLSQFEEFDEFRSGRARERRNRTRAKRSWRPDESETPEEQMDDAYRELRSALAAELLDRVREQSWQFFEDLVLDVLRATGYGGPRGATERLGRSGTTRR